MDQIEELDVVAAYCEGFNGSAVSTSNQNSRTTASLAESAVVASRNPASGEVEVDSLEKALGIEFTDSAGVQRQLLAK